MPKVSLKHMVMLTPDQAFKIAADVASYKDFVPQVTRSVIRGEVKEQGSEKRFAADMGVSVHTLGLSFNEAFTSQVTADSSARRVTAISTDGPMKSLKAEWNIKAIDGSRSTVTLDVDYEFKSKLVQFAAGHMMDKAVARLLDAFEARGKVLYPNSALPNI